MGIGILHSGSGTAEAVNNVHGPSVECYRAGDLNIEYRVAARHCGNVKRHKTEKVQAHDLFSLGGNHV